MAPVYSVVVLDFIQVLVISLLDCALERQTFLVDSNRFKYEFPK